MPGISDTIRRLQASRAVPSFGTATPSGGRLQALPSFGSNPGALTGWYDAPEEGVGMPLVVVLHGCTQTAAGYDLGAGWSDLARRCGFAVLFPEQQRQNNANLCFNWFNAEDTRRGGGEAESIRQMIAAMLARHAIDPARVFVTGLSAGGAMASVMLATYPELFAGGGIIAGLPHGAATSMPEAFERMRGQGHPDQQVYVDRILAASPHAGPWPTISVWHGSADQTVSPTNADRIVEQWRGVHGAGVAPAVSEMIDGHSRRSWRGRDGREVIEVYGIAGLGHGTPLQTGGPDGCGQAGPHMLEAGISSTRRLAASWGLLSEERRVDVPLAAQAKQVRPARAAAPVSSVQTVIEDALRTAGLLK